MQPLQIASERSVRQTAETLLEVVPEVMYFLRGSLRCHKYTQLTIAQVRTLIVVHRRPHGTLSEIADLLGISLPAASRIIDGLVEKKLIRRQASPQDRRNLSLVLTASGEKAMRQARDIGQQCLVQRLSRLSEPDHQQIRAALEKLLGLFEGTDQERGGSPKR